MTDITVTLTDSEIKCLEYCANSVQEWAENALQNRANVAKKEILAKLLSHCNAENITMATGEDAQITQAYDLGVVKTAAQRQEEYEASLSE